MKRAITRIALAGPTALGLAACNSTGTGSTDSGAGSAHGNVAPATGSVGTGRNGR